MNYEHLRQEDAEIFAAMEQELTRQRDHIELIVNNLDGVANKPRIGEYDEGIVMMKYNEIMTLRG